MSRYPSATLPLLPQTRGQPKAGRSDDEHETWTGCQFCALSRSEEASNVTRVSSSEERETSTSKNQVKSTRSPHTLSLYRYRLALAMVRIPKIRDWLCRSRCAHLKQGMQLTIQWTKPKVSYLNTLSFPHLEHGPLYQPLNLTELRKVERRWIGRGK